MSKQSAVEIIEQAQRTLKALADRAAHHLMETGSNAAENLQGCLDEALNHLDQAREFYAPDFDKQTQ